MVLLLSLKCLTLESIRILGLVSPLTLLGARMVFYVWTCITNITIENRLCHLSIIQWKKTLFTPKLYTSYNWWFTQFCCRMLFLCHFSIKKKRKLFVWPDKHALKYWSTMHSYYIRCYLLVVKIYELVFLSYHIWSVYNLPLWVGVIYGRGRGCGLGQRHLLIHEPPFLSRVWFCDPPPQHSDCFLDPPPHPNFPRAL